MEIKEFVKQVLIDLDGAVEEAREGTKRDVHFSPSKPVEFDIAVTVNSQNAKGGDAKVNIFEVVRVGGEASTTRSDETVTRIKFSVGIDKWTKSEEGAKPQGQLQLKPKHGNYR